MLTFSSHKNKEKFSIYNIHTERIKKD